MQVLLASMQHHCWYLSKHLVLLALADDDIELELKSKILDKLLDCEVPDLFKIGKPDLPVVLCQQSCILTWVPILVG